MITLCFALAVGLQDPAAQVAELLSKLASESVEEREKAAERLVALGEAALAPLERRRDDPDAEFRGRVRDIIGEIRFRGFEKSLPDDLRKRHPELSRWILRGAAADQLKAIQALTGVSVDESGGPWDRLNADRLKEEHKQRDYGGRAAPIVAEIARRARSARVREAAVFGLEWLFPAGDEDRSFRAGVARGYLDDPDDGVRLRAVDLLWSTLQEKSRDAIASRLGDASAVVRLRAVEHLAELQDARVVDGAEEKCFSDPDPRVKSAYFKLAVKRDGRKAAPLVIKALEGSLRMNACGAVVEHDLREALPALREIVRRGDGYAYYAVKALGELGDPQALPAMMELSRKPSHARLGETFLNAYGMIGDRAALSDVTAALESKYSREQGAALWAASVIDEAGSRDRLKKILEEAPVSMRDSNRAFAVYALADLGENMDARLVELAGSRDNQVSNLLSVGTYAPSLTGNLFLFMLNRSRSPAVYERLRRAKMDEPYLNGTLRQVLDRIFKSAGVPHTTDASIPEHALSKPVHSLTRPNAACVLARLTTVQYAVGFVFEKEGVRVVRIEEARQALGVKHHDR